LSLGQATDRRPKATLPTERAFFLLGEHLRFSILASATCIASCVARLRRLESHHNKEQDMKKSIWHRYGYGWVTLGFFILSLVGHWVFAWFAYVDEQNALGAPVEASGYLIQVSRDTLENWQSEFLQLLWQVGGLAFLLYVGSPQSKEGDDRMEAKIDAILAAVNPKNADALIDQIEQEYVGRHTDSRWTQLAKKGSAG
jgi:hypothetical protein